jgi:predicted RNase H-like HicB family nuclease
MKKTKRNALAIKEPKTCHLWQKEIVTKDDLDFAVVAEIFKSSHFDRFVVRCKRCGQLYLYEFVEEGKWGGGDTIHTAFIPVEQRDIGQLRNEPSVRIFSIRPRLQWEFDSLYWVGRQEPKEKSVYDVKKGKTKIGKSLHGEVAAELPKGVIVYPPSEETGNKYIAEVPLLKSCRAWGDTSEEALNKLSHMAGDYIRSVMAEIADRRSEIAARLKYRGRIESLGPNTTKRRRTIPSFQRPLSSFAVPHPISCIDFSRNGKYAVAIGNITGDDSKPDLSVLDVVSREVTPLYGRGRPSYSIVRVALSSSGDFALAAQDDGGILCVVNQRNGTHFEPNTFC